MFGIRFHSSTLNEEAPAQPLMTMCTEPSQPQHCGARLIKILQNLLHRMKAWQGFAEILKDQHSKAESLIQFVVFEVHDDIISTLSHGQSLHPCEESSILHASHSFKSSSFGICGPGETAPVLHSDFFKTHSHWRPSLQAAPLLIF